MADRVGGENRILPHEPVVRPLKIDRNLLLPPKVGAGDAAPVSPGEGLKAFRAQAKALKAELPAIIADALLAPEEDTATQQAPLTALVFRLGTPLHSLRAVSRGGWLPPPLVRGLKKELGRFKHHLSTLPDHPRLQPFLKNEPDHTALNEILFRLMDRLIGMEKGLDADP